MNRRSIEKVLNRYWQDAEISGSLTSVIDKESEKELINDLFALCEVSRSLPTEEEIISLIKDKIDKDTERLIERYKNASDVDVKLRGILNTIQTNKVKR